jgi:hypothetical protein
MSQEQYEQYIGGDPAVYEEGETYEQQPIPVEIQGVLRHTPELVSCMTWTIPQAGVGMPIQILQRTIHRFKAKITITAVQGATQIIFSNTIDRVQGANPQGCIYSPPAALDFDLPDWESQQPCYAICIGGTATVAVQDERFLERAI